MKKSKKEKDERLRTRQIAQEEKASPIDYSYRQNLKALVDSFLLSTGVRLADPVTLTIPEKPKIVRAVPIHGDQTTPFYFVMDSELIPSYQPWPADAGGVVVRHQRGSRAQAVFTVSKTQQRDLPDEWKNVHDILQKRKEIFKEIDHIDRDQYHTNAQELSEFYDAIGESLADALLVHLPSMNDFLEKEKESSQNTQRGGVSAERSAYPIRLGQDDRMRQARHRILSQWLPHLQGLVDNVIKSGGGDSKVVYLIDAMNVMRSLYRQLRQKRYKTTPPAQMNQAIDRYIEMIRGKPTDPQFRAAPKIYVAVRLLPQKSSAGSSGDLSYTLTVMKQSARQTVLRLPVWRHPPPAILLDRCMDDLVLMTLASLFLEKNWRPIIISNDQYRDWNFEGQVNRVASVFPRSRDTTSGRSQGGGEAASR